MSSEWTAVAISVVVVLAGVGVNLFVIGRFIGQWAEAMRNITATLTTVKDEAGATASLAEATAGHVQLLDARVKVTESAADKFWEMRDAFIRMTTTIEFEGKQSREKLDSLARGQSVMERQLASMLTTRAGFTTLVTENANQDGSR